MRLVSGDHHQTCVKVAIETGIITQSQAKEENVCLSGEQFYDRIGGVIKNWDH